MHLVFTICLAALMILPLIVSARAGRRGDVDTMLTNAGRNTLGRTVAGVVCGNVGIGSFVAIYLFAGQSPVIGASVALAYTSGLLICAASVRRIRARAHELGTVSLVEMLAGAHGLATPWPLWLPVAAVFILRAAVQLAALALLIDGATGIGVTPALIGSGLILAGYTALGGYRAAVETDVGQALVIVLLMLPVWFALPAGPPEAPAFFELGPHAPTLLLGIWAFVPWSAVLAVDNWQRITLAQDEGTARNAFLIATPICGAIFVTIAWVGYALPGGNVFATFRALMPAGAPWLADLLFVTAIMSSIDTFVMPLVMGTGTRPATVARLRAILAGLFTVVICVALMFGAVLSTVIAAFSSLSVFLPAVAGALWRRPGSGRAAIVSMNGGVITAAALTVVDQNIAGLCGFAVALITYLALHGRAGRG